MTDLARLVVKLEAQTADYDKKLEQATRTLQSFKRRQESIASGLGKTVAVGVSAAAGAFALMTRNIIDTNDRLAKLSQSTGISVGELSKLEYAADLSGASVEQMRTSLAKLAKVSVEATDKGSEAARAFAAIGVSVKNADGSMKSTGNILGDVADAFAQFEDGPAKAAVAMALFGRSGADLIPLLNGGRAAIKAAGDELQEFGGVATADAAAASEKFNDNLTRLQTAVRGVLQSGLNRVLPILQMLSDRLIESAKKGGFLNDVLRASEAAFKVFVTAGAVALAGVRQLGTGLAAVGFALVELAQGNFQRAAEEIQYGFGLIKDIGNDAADIIAKTWADKLPAIADEAKKTDDRIKKTLIFGGESDAANKALDKAHDKLRDMAADLQQQVDTYNQGEAAVIRYRVAHGDLAATIKEAGAEGEQYGAKIVSLTDRLEALKQTTREVEEEQEKHNRMMEDGRSITASVRTAAEVYADTVEDLDAKLAKGAITQETYNRALIKAQNEMQASSERMSEFMDQARRNSVDIIANALETGFEGGLKNIGRAFEQMLVRLSAQAVAAHIGEKIFGVPGTGTTPGIPGIFDMVANWASSTFGGGRASGGPVAAGTAYRVGENGPEYFVPPVAGEIVPARNMGGIQVVNNFSIQAPRGEVSRQTQAQIAALAARGIAAASRRNN